MKFVSARCCIGSLIFLRLRILPVFLIITAFGSSVKYSDFLKTTMRTQVFADMHLWPSDPS